jgi:ABC-type uncharacterized transport system ATPase subunit
VIIFTGRLLREVRKISGKILLIWDGSPIHRGHEIKDIRQQRAAKRLHLEHLPGYAADLNPDEGIWNDRAAGSSWALSAVPIEISRIEHSCKRMSACGTKRRSSQAALANVALRFRS